MEGGRQAEEQEELPLGLTCINTAIRVFRGYSIFPNRERNQTFLVLSL